MSYPQLLRSRLHSFTKFFAGLLVLVSCLGLFGCSAIKLAYNNLDSVILFWLNRYLDLDSTQETWVKSRLTVALQWHRTNQLPEYATLLEQVSGQIQRGEFDVAQARRVNQLVRQHGYLILQHLTPDLAEFAKRLRAEQITYLEKRFARENKKYIDEFLSGSYAERMQARSKKTLEYVELIFDGLNREQEETIHKLTFQYPIDSQILFDERQARQQAMLELLRRIQSDNLDSLTVQQRIQQLIQVLPQRSLDAQRRIELQADQEKSLQLSQTIISLLTDAQRQRGVQRMANWAKEARELAQQK